MSKITPKKYAVGLYQVLKEAEASQIPSLIKSFIRLLYKNRDLSRSGRIVAAFNQYANQQDKILEVTLVSSKALETHQKHEIVEQLKKSLNQSIKIHEQIDPSLLGGLIIKYGDRVIDGSLKNKIELLHTNLVN